MSAPPPPLPSSWTAPGSTPTTSSAAAPPTLPPAPATPAAPTLPTPTAPAGQHGADVATLQAEARARATAAAFAHQPPPPAPARSRGVLSTVLLIVGVLGVAGIAAYGFVTERNEQRWPEVTATPDHRSVVYEFDDADENGARFESTVRMDLVTGEVDVDTNNGGSWRGDETAWYQYDGEIWIRYENSESDDRQLAEIRRIASGVTIDQLLPPAARRHAVIDDVDRVELETGAVRHFSLRLQIDDLLDDRTAITALIPFWGAEIETTFNTNVDQANLEIWVDDEGIVHRWSSESDLDRSSVRWNLVSTSDEPFDAQLPTNYTDAAG